jgi:hypothetical protein
MDPRDVNRINYNNYYVGQNLDFLIRSKMRSESLSTPLTNTPVFYDDQVSSKMALLGKRGYYDPGYIYGFDNQNEKRDNYNYNNIPNKNNSPQKYENNDINERRNYINQNPKENLYQINQENDLEMQRRQPPLQREQYNYDKPNNAYVKENDINIGPKQYDINSNQNESVNQKNNNNRNNEEFRREYNEYIKKQSLYQEQNNQLNNKMDDVNPGKTREQIQYDTFIENYKRQQYVKQRMMDDEMKYRQDLYKK